MADDLKQLNKTVTEAVNLLKVYLGNTAQVKAMNEKQREAIDKWLKVTDEADETQKKQRAFTERARDAQGRFIAKQETQAKNFMGMAKSVSGMFKGMVKGIGNTLTSISNGITSNLTSLFQTIKSHFLGLFGEESEWFDILSSIKDSITGFVGWFAKGFMMIFRRTPNWAGKMIKYLKDSYALQVKQMKMDFMDMGEGAKKKGGVWGILGGILLGIAAGIGAWLHRYLFLITQLPIFKKVSDMFKVIDDIPFIGKLFKAVKFGFKWLGWPLTILMSAIDFIRGYAETEGSMWEKIKGGLWKAIEGFIVLPVTFIGWVVEKVAELFGVEIDNVGEKIMGIMEKGFMMIFEGWELIFSLVNEHIIQKIPEWSKKIIGAVTDAVTGVFNFFANLWNSIVEFVTTKIPKWALPKSWENMKKVETPTTDLGASVTDQATNLEKTKIEEQKKRDAKLDDLNKSVQDTGAKTQNAFAAMIPPTLPANTGIVDTQQIKDELDNNAVSFGNSAWGLE